MDLIMPDPSPHDLMNAALEIGAAAEPIPRRYFRSGVAVEEKPDESPVTVADRETETRIREEIAARFPDHGIFGEEFGKSKADSEFTWVVDPIDGTRSFICGVPLFGMLIGVLQGGEPVAGVVRMPALGESYAGCRGGSATMNGADIRCRKRPVSEAYVFINEANLMVEPDLQRLKRLMHCGHDQRFFNDCYAFALLAAGKIDAVVDTGLQPYDYLPIAPVVEAAGCIMTDWQGAPLGLGSDGTVVAAATPELHAELMRLLQ
jgi:inositol-phosphate phosphatase/L-galactose 1-phosphate phosphatase/histidinol-phosphatase